MQLLTIDDIAQLFGVKRRTVADKWMARPDFPPPRFAPSRRTRRWDMADIMRWASPASARSARRSRGSTASEEATHPDDQISAQA